MADSYEINLEIQGGEQPALVMETEGGATDGASARAAEAWANGTRNGVPVEEGDPAYNKSSKYYRDSAAAIAAGDVIDDDAGIGDTMLAWSADKLVKEFGGTQENMTAGNALYLLSDRGETDNEPYVFRKTGGAKNAYGREKLRKLVGGTIAWNQLVSPATFPDAHSENGVNVSWQNGKMVLNGTTTDTSWLYVSRAEGDNIPANNHKYLAITDEKPNEARLCILVDTGGGLVPTSGTANYAIYNNVNGIRAIVFRATANVQMTFSCNPQLFDLTQMFGSTIADAIYAMEQATAGSGVAWFRSLFPKSYYAYDAGTLMSVNAESHQTVGFNQWDEQWELGSYNTQTGAKQDSTTGIRNKNGINVLAGAVYSITKPTTSQIYSLFYDASGNVVPYVKESGDTAAAYNSSARFSQRGANYLFTIPSGAVSMNIRIDDATVYKNDICINLSDTAKNGTYEPYQLRSYPLANVELRGIPKWVDGQMVFDGDEYTPDGTVKRRYGIVDLGTLTWSTYSGVFFANVTGINHGASFINLICSKYLTDNPKTSVSGTASWVDKAISGNAVQNEYVYVKDTAYENSSASDFQTAMSGVYLVYELATPTTETADPYRELQISNRNGTEKFVDRAEEAGTRDVAIPVGTETFYPIDVFALIDSLQAMILENISNS